MLLTSYPTVVHLLRDRAQRHPDRIAYRFLKDGEMEAGFLTYGVLDQQARAIATHLLTQAKPGDRAVLIYPYEAALEFIVAFFGCLYAGVIAVPCHPPRNQLGVRDVQARLLSSAAAIVLSTQSLVSKLQRQLLTPVTSDFHSLDWICTDMIPVSRAVDWTERAIAIDSLAFLQYTSGSTGKPKGVMVSHAGLFYNQQMLQSAFGHTENSVGVGWLPLFHDMGLVGNVIQVIYGGMSCVLMSPIAFVQKPIRWLQAISRYRGTTSGAPNFAYDMLCRQVTLEQRQSLDLSRWEVAFCGAEPVRMATLEQFATLFASSGFQRSAFYPCYGMAEATLFITGGQKQDLPKVLSVDAMALEENRVVLTQAEDNRGRSLVSCGHAWLDGQIAIVHPDTLTRCAPDQVGEIWVSGSGLGKGYWQMPEESDRTFHAYLKDSGEGPFLRTGDLGFLWDGELYITGRLHDVLVFWGFNHYPHHIEQTVVDCHPAFTSNCAAVAMEIHGETRLAIAQEVDRSYRGRISVAEVVELIRWHVFDQHFIDVSAIALVKPGSIPKTSSGKVQRSTCRNQWLNGELEILDEWRSPQAECHDMTSLIERYFNPITHVKRYSALMQGRLQRWLKGS